MTQENKPQNIKRPPGVPKKPPKDGRNMAIWILVALGVFYLLYASSATLERPPEELAYGRFYAMLKNNAETGRIAAAIKTETIVQGRLSSGERFTVHIPEGDQELLKLLRENIPDFDVKPSKTLWSNLFYSLGPMILFIAFLYFFIYRGAAQGGSKILSFGKSRARQFQGGQTKITFDDVAGVDEAKEELKEVIEFLKDPKKFQRLGGKMPKGVLVVGPPGTGKTLLAKAVAGEANVHFFSISGSDFVEMFVGVGASRVRDLFEQAKKSVRLSKKGCIIFVDEIDAVGRQRFAGIGGGHDEREQTLNALLAEMDGFDTQEGVIMIAATNRPDVLDPALLRPGRFDRHIVVDRPDIGGREAILKVHVRHVKMDGDVDLKRIAKQTSGFSGADLANLVNEAALLAARRDKKSVEQGDLEESIERVMAGPQRKSRIVTKEEKRNTAYHESGHALLSLIIPEADPMHKVTIVSRGIALGYTWAPPQQDRYRFTRKWLMAQLVVLLGGRAAEEIMSNELSTGAHNDLSKVSEIARNMVTQYGMSEKLGHITYGIRHEQIFLGRDIHEEKNYSDETARLIDQEVKRIVDESFQRSRQELLARKDKLEKLAEALLEKEVMDDKEVKEIVGLNDVSTEGKTDTKKS
jgi:cell division protease FtsH